MIGLVVIASSVTGIGAVATYSGIYNLKAGFPVVVAITKGGHVLSLSNDTSINGELNPSKSTVNATGKIVGSTNEGTSVAAQIKSDFSVSGTAKNGGQTSRITGNRILK